jgi:hypothetical protein
MVLLRPRCHTPARILSLAVLVVLVNLLYLCGKVAAVGSAKGYASDYGYVDLSFQCDVRITCPQVCAASVEECPNELKCLNRNETLCKDGSCALFCNNDALYSPCEELSPCATVTCASIDTDHAACSERFSPWYHYATECPGFTYHNDLQDATLELSWLSKQYVAVYCWMTSLTIAIISWCWYK